MATGDLVKPFVAIIPAAQVAGTVNGPAIDRAGALDCVVYALTGAETGTPSARSAALKLQDSDDGLAGWNDIAAGGLSSITAINSASELNYDLRSAKAFIRVVSTVSFTAGTAPTLYVAAVVLLGGFRKLPAT